MSTIHVPAQRTAPDTSAAPAVVVTAPVELGWRALLRRTVARAALAMVASLVTWSLLPALVGMAPHVIMSGSMEPRIHVGDIIVTRAVPATTLVKGNVITVSDPDHPEKTRTHRFVRRAADGTIVTKGDANPTADSSHVTDAAVLGLGVIRVPFVGRAVYWMAERNFAALGVTFLLLGWCVVSAFPGKPKNDESDDTSDDTDLPKPRSRPRPDRGSRRRRIAAAATVGVIAVGAVGAPADAAFKKSAVNPTSTLAAAVSFHPYQSEVVADSPYLYWKLDDTSGTTTADTSGTNHPGTLLAQTTAFNQVGALTSETPNRAMGFSVTSITANAAVAAPSTFSVEAWVKSTSTTGGRIIGFGNASGSTTATTQDRLLYLGANGKVYFGVGSAKTTVASTGVVNNGTWHHVVGTFVAGASGMKLYVDGALQGSTTATVQSYSANGYWRAGAEQMTGWASNPTDNYYDGTLDELAVYTDVLTPAEALSHYRNATN
ncbi:MAG: signal peptidase [Marmoricola sp.]|nr:signal peptidase [Marmoricola sp.]